jgi:hypothetical protein
MPQASDDQAFEIESFEIGKGLWHARFRRANRKPILIDGVLLAFVEIGFAWPDADVALADARAQIKRFSERYGTLESPA